MDAIGKLTLGLKERGVDAHYEHTGGGIFCCAVYPNDGHRILFGDSDGPLGASIDNEDGTTCINVESGLDPASPEAVDWALALIRPEVGVYQSIAITDPWLDETGRFSVEPWSYYGIPLPAGATRD